MVKVWMTTMRSVWQFCTVVMHAQNLWVSGVVPLRHNASCASLCWQ